MSVAFPGGGVDRAGGATRGLWTRRQFALTGGCALAGARLGPLIRHAGSGYQAIVLGSIQDGGLPQAGCYSARCDRARAVPYYVTSLAVVEEVSGRVWLVDASPDIVRQMDLIPGDAFRRRTTARRPFEGILLTHAHMGHYLGLAELGREGLGIEATPCFCTASMAEFLASNGPWDLMVREGRLDLRIVRPDVPWSLAPGLEVAAIAVPHREEYSDTVAFRFRGDAGSLLYLPDIDSWDAWDREVVDVVSEVDVALLDATFYSIDELPGRDQSDVPHPLAVETMRRLGPLTDEHRIVLTHLNNSNPLLDEGGRERAAAVAAGFEIARAGQRFDL